MQRSEQAVETFRYTGEHLNESYALNRLADIHTRLRDFDTAIATAENALAIRRDLQDDFGIASSLITLADISSLQGDFTKALQYAQQAQDIGFDIADHRIRVSSLVRIARNQQRLGDLEQATETFRSLESLAQAADDGHNVWRARLGIADTLISRGLYDDALAIGNRVIAGRA